jgi:hypothetical protein
MTYVQQNKRNLVIAAAAAAGAPVAPSFAAEAAHARRLRVRFPRPRRMTTRTLVLAALVASVPVTVTATAVVHHALTASQHHVRSLGSDANGNSIQMPVIDALPAADASTWSALTRPPGDAELDADNMAQLQTLQADSRFGLNAGLARQLAVRDGYGIWLIPGNGFVCIGIRRPGDRGMSQGCNTDDAARGGALQAGDGTNLFGIVPDGVRSITVTDADTGLRHDEPVTDNVYELAYKPATVTLTVPGEQPVTFDVLR